MFVLRKKTARDTCQAPSCPTGEVERRLASLPRDLEIVAYCRGRRVLRLRGGGGQVLRRNGFAARRME